MKNKDIQKIYIALQVILLFILPTILFFIGIFCLKTQQSKIALMAIYTLFLIGLAIYLTIILQRHFKNSILAKKSLEFYLQSEFNQFGTGILIFLNSGKIIWASESLKIKFHNNLINKNIKDIFNIKQWTSDNQEFMYEIDGCNYEVHISFEKNLVILRDVTAQQNLLDDYKKQRIVFGELDIDNINLYQTFLSQEEIFKIYASVVNLLDEISKKYNVIYRQYENGRFFLITNKETLEELERDSFNVITSVKNKIIVKDVLISISGGFGYGIFKYDTLVKLAKDALMQSQMRGGDQITVLTKNEKARHYGSSSEIDVNLSRTNVNYIAQNLLEKIKSKDIENVIAYGHKNADLDALGSTYAILQLALAYKKNAYIQNKTFDSTTQRVIDKMSKETQEYFISPKEAEGINNEKTLVVICDTSDDTRIENANVFKNIKKENIMIIDHHRINKNTDEIAYRENVYIDSSASSASEILTEIITLLHEEDKINNDTAQYLLDGIYLDTNTFKKQTSAKTFAAASILQKWGAQNDKSVDTLKFDEKVFKIVQELLANLQEIKKGYFLAYKDIEASTDIISIASDEILRVNGRKAAFVVAKLPGTKTYKMSARGINTNVQIIAEAVNGGGHFGAAAAETTENLNLFVDNIIQAIVSVKDNESNIN